MSQPVQGYGYDQPTVTPGERQTGLTTEESYDNIDPSSANYEGNQKKASIFGKLKDKTKKAGSKIKSKVGKKKNADGTVGDEEDEEDDIDDSPSPSPSPSPASAVSTTPYTGPQSVPREFGTYPSEGKSDFGESDSAPDMSGLSLNETPDKDSASEKASGGYDGAKGAMYGGAAATAGAAGYGAMGGDRPEEKSVGEKTSEASSDAAGRAEEFGRGGYNRAADAKDTVADKASEGYEKSKDALTPDSDRSDVPGSVTEAAYQAKDNVKEKAAGVNNATDDSETYTDKASKAAYAAKDTAADKMAGVNNATNDSETYTQKASNAAVAAKDTVANTLGMNQPSGGPSVADKAKGYLGSAVDTTKAYTFGATDAAKNTTGAAKDTTMDTTGSAADTTKDYATGAKDTTTDNMGSAADTTKAYATSAKDSVADAATPKQDDKALSAKITDALGGLTTPANTSTAAHDEANSGILGKLGGMFGYGQKGPDDAPTSTTH